MISLNIKSSKKKKKYYLSDVCADDKGTNEPAIPFLDDDNFANLIEKILSENVKDWDVRIPKTIREQKIDSQIYDMMTEKDKEDLIPRLGERLRVNMEWQNIKSGKSEIGRTGGARNQVERLRKFDRPASERIKYKQGSFVTKRVRRPGNLIFPVHKYFMFEVAAKRKDMNLNTFLDEVIKFAAACLNDKTNGTFHAGISESGEIVGSIIDIDKVDEAVTKAIRENFKEYQVETVLKCIRSPQCIEVISASSKIDNKHVVEIDVVPQSAVVGNQTFSVKGKKKGMYLFYRYLDCEVKELDPAEIGEYIDRERNVLLEQRVEAEKRKTRARKENLTKTFKDFFCCGENEFEESLYPVLVLSHMKAIDRPKFASGDLFKSVPWRAVLDFNEKDDENGFQEIIENVHGKVFITHTIEDFSHHKRDDKTLKKTRDEITESSVPAWIYCNGSGKNESNEDARTWIHEKSKIFEKVLEFYNDIIPDRRGRICIPIFEKGNSVFTEAITQLILTFKKQCLVLSPSKSIVSMCWHELSCRPNTFPPKSTIDDFFLIGLPWNQINECIDAMIKLPKQLDGIQIPRSNGPPFTVEKKTVNELSDLDIVSINESFDIEHLDDEEKHLKEQQAREEYYQGGCIQWSNFFFKDQVLERDVYKELETHIRHAVELYDQEYLAVQKVAVYHQPGSGGSTTSRQILWNLRQDYRCCVVNKITNQTCDQIGRFRVLGEENDEENDIKPVLVLLDDNNEDAIAQFVDDLENESYNYNCDSFCVLLICFRVSALPLDRPAKYVMLRQVLSKDEHCWFQKSYDNLITKYNQNRGCNPKTLLAFNIMKENFNEESIKKSVRDFICDLTEKQRKMLKHLSFLNAYDLHFQSVPISCFDPLMAPPVQWIKYLNPSIRVLTSLCRKQGYGGHNSAIRMSNYRLSKPVLNTILDIEREKALGEGQTTVGELALEVMDSDCFRISFYKHEHKILMNILGDIMKKRDRIEANKGKLEKFSPLITELLDQKDTDQAIKIVSTTYEITDDPLVAQQLARLNAEVGNWEKAHQAIDDAINKKPNNSYLIHTKGQLYKDQMQTSFSSFNKEGTFPESNVDEAIRLTDKAMACYRKSQSLSESQDMSQQNPAGYESEILMAIELLRLLNQCTSLKPLSAVMRRSIRPEIISQQNYSFLKALPAIVNITVEKLERILHGTNRHIFHSHSRSLYTLEKKQLDRHKRELAKHFDVDNTLTLNKNEKFVPANVWSFLSAIRYADMKGLLKTIQIMSRQMNELRHYQLRIYLAMCFSVSLWNPSMIPIDPNDLLLLSRKYYETFGSSKSELAKLESYLYFTVFHWPLHSRQNWDSRISPYSVWSRAVSEWLQMDSKRSFKQRRSDKIFFYLGNKEQYPGLIRIEGSSSISNLARFQGIVNDNGTEINLTIHSFQSNQGHSLKIPFVKRLGRNVLYNRRTEVVIGIGLQGPRADWLEKPSSFRTFYKSSSKKYSQRQHHSMGNAPERYSHGRDSSQRNQGINSFNEWPRNTQSRSSCQRLQHSAPGEYQNQSQELRNTQPIPSYQESQYDNLTTEEHPYKSHGQKNTEPMLSGQRLQPWTTGGSSYLSQGKQPKSGDLLPEQIKHSQWEMFSSTPTNMAMQKQQGESKHAGGSGQHFNKAVGNRFNVAPAKQIGKFDNLKKTRYHLMHNILSYHLKTKY